MIDHAVSVRYLLSRSRGPRRGVKWPLSNGRSSGVASSSDVKRPPRESLAGTMRPRLRKETRFSFVSQTERFGGLF